MSARAQGIDAIWKTRPVVIGMVHLLPLPGAPRWGGSMDAVVERAVRDAEALSSAGFDGIIVENFSDAPFFPDSVPPETTAGMTRALVAVASATSVPLGVNVLRNDARSAVAVASATGARFVRVNVLTGSMWTDQGLIEGAAADTMRLRATLTPDLAVLADVHVKHAVPPAGSDLAEAARDTWHRGLADALIVSGAGTSQPTAAVDVRSARSAVPEATLLIGSGVTAENGPGLLADADGAIIGSAVMEHGRAGNAIDLARADALRSALRAPP